jgi:DNA anti-recombination protein RmuC
MSIKGLDTQLEVAAMSSVDSQVIVSALAYPLSVTLLIGLVCIGVMLRGWVRLMQNKQDAKLAELQNHQHQLESQIARQGDAIAQRVETWSRDVNTQLGGQAQQLRTMNEAVGSLKTAIVVPHLRGRILGETTLQRLLSDVLPPHGYAFKAKIGDATADAVICFPHIGLVCPIDCSLEFSGAQTLLEGHAEPAVMMDVRRQLAQEVKSAAKEISRRLIRPELGTTDFAYLFVSSEGLFQEILHDIDLWQSLVTERVLVVSPHTLFVALQPLSHAIRYYEMSAGVNEKIRILQDAERQMKNMSLQIEEQLGRVTQSVEQTRKFLSLLPALTHAVKAPQTDESQIQQSNAVRPEFNFVPAAEPRPDVSIY